MAIKENSSASRTFHYRVLQSLRLTFPTSGVIAQPRGDFPQWCPMRAYRKIISTLPKGPVHCCCFLLGSPPYRTMSDLRGEARFPTFQTPPPSSLGMRNQIFSAECQLTGVLSMMSEALPPRQRKCPPLWGKCFHASNGTTLSPGVGVPLIEGHAAHAGGLILSLLCLALNLTPASVRLSHPPRSWFVRVW